MKNNRTTLIAIAILLLAGIAAVLLLQQKPAKDGTTLSQNAGSKAGKDAPLSSDEERQSRAPERSRTRAAPKDQDLVATYGESRTNLSRQVSTHVVEILEDAVQSGELMQASQAGFGGLIVALGGLVQELALTEEQIAKASGFYTDYHKRQLDQTKEAVARLKQNPAALMKLMLASDANARGEIQDDEYKRLQTESGKDLAGVLNPLESINIGGSPLRDEAFRSEFKSTLDPEQRRKLEESMALEAGATPDDGSISNMPKMELEKLDASIQDAKKITSGIKGIMEVIEKSYTTPPPAAPAGGEN